MRIDSKIDPRWCEALLNMLEGDLSHSRVAEAKQMLKSGIDFIRESQTETIEKMVQLPGPPIRLGVGLQSDPLEIPDSTLLSGTEHGCLLSGPGRGDCEHFVGLPGKSIPGRHDGPDDTVDEYGRPNGWCEVCWRGRQIQFLEYALFNFAANYGGIKYAEDVVKAAVPKAETDIRRLTENDIAEIAKQRKTRCVYVVKATKLKSRPVYVEGVLSPGVFTWTPFVNSALQFSQRTDAELYLGTNDDSTNDGAWEIVEYVL